MSATLDVFLSDTGTARAVVYARHGGDLASTTIPFDSTLAALTSFRARLDRAVRGLDPHPPPTETAAFGRQIFTYLIRGPVASLYARLPEAHVRLQLACSPALAAIPWEFLQEPGHPRGPRRHRTIARIVSAEGHIAPRPVSMPATVPVLFVSAAPVDQGPVHFPIIKSALELAFRARLPRRFTMEAVDGATRDSFHRALTSHAASVLHFCGHGDTTPEGRGRLLLEDRRSRKTSYIDAEDFAAIAAGRGIRLVILSACETAAGNFHDDFAVTAAALIRAGIPAVVAHQFPIPNQAVAPFASALYAALLAGEDIDTAVTEGRLALLANLDSFEWGIPTLYRHYEATRIFE